MEELHAWDPRLDTGHAGIDAEHHVQLGLANELVVALERARPVLARSLAERLRHQSFMHFGAEELLIARARSQHAHGHAAEHRGLLAQQDELLRVLEEGATELALSLALDHREALARHVYTADVIVAHASEAWGGGAPR
jgi:hemerythrin-like metal-binding protein